MLGSVFLECLSYLKVSFFSVINNKIMRMLKLRSDNQFVYLLIPAVLLTKRKPLELSFASQYKDVSVYVVTCMFESYCGLKVA